MRDPDVYWCFFDVPADSKMRPEGAEKDYESQYETDFSAATELTPNNGCHRSDLQSDGIALANVHEKSGRWLLM